MKNKLLWGVICLGLVMPLAVSAADVNKKFTGMVTKIYGNQVTIKTTSAASYAAEVGQAHLSRKNGAPMRLDEIVIGDKLEITGRLWPDNSMNAATVRNLSLYAHSGTFTGKIVSVDGVASLLTMYSRAYGTQTIHTDYLTAIKRNKAAATLKDLDIGASVTVKGNWDRDRSNAAAKSVEVTVRLVNIDITGKLMMRGDTFLSIVGQNTVLYGVDINNAKLLDKKGKTINIYKLPMGNMLRVTGKHLSEGAQIIASQVKDLGYTK